MGKRSIKEVKDTDLEKKVEGENVKPKEKKSSKHEHKKQKKTSEKSDKKKKDKKEKKRKEKSEAESTSQEGESNGEEEKTTPKQDSSQSTTNEAARKEYAKEHEINYLDPLSKTPLLPLLDFSELPIHDNLRLGLKNFKDPTPIQAASWPYLFAGRDVVGIAETGSGKTVAFGIPALQYLQNLPKEKPTTRILVVSPTRELAIQTYENIKGLTSDTMFKVAVVYGGAPKNEQVRAARDASVIIGTPGRLLDLINDGAVDCSNVGYLVLDEADRMLDTGFEQDIRNIISQTPDPLKGGARQTVFYSATWPESVRSLAATFLKDPVKITIGSDELSASQNITQIVELLNDSREKERTLINIISKNLASAKQGDKILVFVLYKKEAARVENTLARRFNAVGIHGDMSQGARIQALESFKSNKSPVLVATDVAARGLDIPKVQLVINVTFPLTIEDYIHRIGRTGRANTKGVAHTFFTPEDKSHAGELINVLRQAKQEIPEGLYKYGTAVKPKVNAYGSRITNDAPMKAATKITFD
ncbi:ATP-dependent RNA helicase dbp3 [Schizosaccharomyces octosporus yFS286]|uniref:RNA helicase n=1 Tax=Schizosaccharomyces octosporus (strain yFS286) TaxID=483514 RepID=S9RE24_SCHOY|nr:ATP-dependent RNA helicase dbp3 [Schizosaccharomyces octosporus yFS286]EPX72334.1 ATP-dependent RNA helicase dbp3 [Schizosaccharomyces octosporus yFS286]